MAQVNEYVQKLIAARDSDLFADVDPLNQLLKPKGETRTLGRRYISHAKRHVSGHACAVRNVMSPFLLDWMGRGATISTHQSPLSENGRAIRSQYNRGNAKASSPLPRQHESRG